MTPATLLRAAALLEREAKTIDRTKCKHAKNSLWANRRDEMLRVAAELRKGVA